MKLPVEVLTTHYETVTTLLNCQSYVRDKNEWMRTYVLVSCQRPDTFSTGRLGNAAWYTGPLHNCHWPHRKTWLCSWSYGQRNFCSFRRKQRCNEGHWLCPRRLNISAWSSQQTFSQTWGISQETINIIKYYIRAKQYFLIMQDFHLTS